MDRQALAIWLYENLPGERVDPIGDLIPGWTPEPGKCHENVARWLAERPGYTAVRGWLDVSFLAMPNRRRFASHSVVADPDGKLLDVTLRTSDGRYGFIRHPWDEAGFLAAVANNGLPTIDYLVSPDVEITYDAMPTTDLGPQF